MKLKFVNHAQYRFVVERNISIESMKSVIRNPESFYVQDDGVIVARKHVLEGNLEVVYARRGNLYIIITSYYKK